MPYLVSAIESCGPNGLRLQLNYGIFSSIEKAQNAIEIFIEKLYKKHINHDHDAAFDEEVLKEEYRDYFNIIKINEIDDETVFREYTPKFLQK
jgi:hypothetical protein